MLQGLGCDGLRRRIAGCKTRVWIKCEFAREVAIVRKGILC